MTHSLELIKSLVLWIWFFVAITCKPYKTSYMTNLLIELANLANYSTNGLVSRDQISSAQDVISNALRGGIWPHKTNNG